MEWLEVAKIVVPIVVMQAGMEWVTVRVNSARIDALAETVRLLRKHVDTAHERIDRIHDGRSIRQAG